MTARFHRTATVLLLVLTAGATVIAQYGNLFFEPATVATIGAALTALVTVLREMADHSGATPVTPP